MSKFIFPFLLIYSFLLPKIGGQANYRVEIVQATNNSLTASVTAVVDFDGEGVFNVWEID